MPRLRRGWQRQRQKRILMRFVKLMSFPRSRWRIERAMHCSLVQRKKEEPRKRMVGRMKRKERQRMLIQLQRM